MTNRLPQLKPKELIRVLEKLGFVFRRQSGSHCILKHPVTKVLVTVPMHNSDLKHGLLLGVVKQVGLTREEFIKYL
jgi:predicted RNA binding protein YcfA (HicA-like mRNA interferase family)